MKIRFAEIMDYNEVEAIAVQAQHYHVMLRPDIYLESTNDSKVLSNEKFLEKIRNKNLIVCIDNDTVVAYLLFEDKNILNPLMKTEKILYIDSLAVNSKFRNKGISKLLMNWIKQFAKDKEYRKIELQVNSRNEIAKRLYEKQGFLTKSINMEYFID